MDLTITAESIRIHNPMATFTIQTVQETVTLPPINPAIRHRFTDDEVAIHQAITPDIGDPPSAERPVHNLRRNNNNNNNNFRGGRGRPLGRGGGPPQGPGGGGGLPQGPGGGGIPQLVHPLTEKFVGNAPIIFTGDRSKTEQFLTQWELYWGVNNNNSLMRNAYT